MSRWFRLYDELLDDPKVQMMPPELFKAWVNILCLASRNEGRLPSVHDMAFSLRMDETLLETFLKQMMERGLVDDDGVSLFPHKWSERQFKSDSSTERVRKYREKLEETGNVTKRLRKRPQIQIQIQKQNKKTPCPISPLEKRRKSDRVEYPGEFEILYDCFPKAPNASKKDAYLVWQRLDEKDRDDAIDGAMGYAKWLEAERRRRPDFPAKHLTTFLNGRGWETVLELAS
jgi:hypothetical protein